MTTRAGVRRPAVPFLLAVATAVGVSVAAYAGMVPPFVSAHGVDKVLHAATGATLTWLLARVLGGRVWLAALLVLLPLATDEYFQRFSATRSSDWADLGADGLGAAVAIFFHVLHRARGDREAFIASRARGSRCGRPW
jgi:VanZ family protein